MTIIKRPPIQPIKSADDFILGAPDAKPEALPVATATATATATAKMVLQGKQPQISLAMPPELLTRVDETARKLSLTRAGFIKLALSRLIEQEKDFG